MGAVLDPIDYCLITFKSSIMPLPGWDGRALTVPKILAVPELGSNTLVGILMVLLPKTLKN